MNSPPGRDDISVENVIHGAYQQRQPFELESSSSLVINHWSSVHVNSSPSTAVVDSQLAKRVWEHACRRIEDQCVILASMHESAPSLLGPFTDQIPFVSPLSGFASYQRGLSLIKAFTNCATPTNPSRPLYAALSVAFDIYQDGNLERAAFLLPQDGLDIEAGLLNIPSSPGHRAFNAFYYLNNPGATQIEREALELRDYNQYRLLNRSGTVSLPSSLAAAEVDAIREFRANLKYFAISSQLVVILSALLLMGNLVEETDEERIEEIYATVAPMLDIDLSLLHSLQNQQARRNFIGAAYSKIIDYVLFRINSTLETEIAATPSGIQSREADDTSVTVTVADVACPILAKAIATRVVFDDDAGINGELRSDSIPIYPVPAHIRAHMPERHNDAAFHMSPTWEDALSVDSTRTAKIHAWTVLLRDLTAQASINTFWHKLLHTDVNHDYKLYTTIDSSRVWFHLSLSPSDSNSELSVNAWNAPYISRTATQWFLADWIHRRYQQIDFTADYAWDELPALLGPLQCPGDGIPAIKSWISNQGWDPSGIVYGNERLWIRESVFQQMCNDLDMQSASQFGLFPQMSASVPYTTPFADGPTASNSSHDDLINRSFDGSRSQMGTATDHRGDYGLGGKGDTFKGITYSEGDGAHGKLDTESRPQSRRLWVMITWGVTFWIPSFLLSFIGRMKRPDVRMAWREKVTLVFLIMLMNAGILFFIIGFGRVLCPNQNKAWNSAEVAGNAGSEAYWVSHSGHVYDLTKFWKLQHSDTAIKTTTATMTPFSGFDMNPYIRPPLNLACSSLVTDQTLTLISNTTIEDPSAIHLSGPYFQADTTTALNSLTWYTDKFLVRMKEYVKGDLVWTRKSIAAAGTGYNKPWVVIDKSVYDLTDYFNTLTIYNNLDVRYDFFDQKVRDLVTNNPGSDVTTLWNDLTLNSTTKANTMQCLNNYFYVGKVDFRKQAQCVVQNYILLVFTIALASVIVIKFLAALQLGASRRPAPQEKFVICQVPAYTEDEDQIRKGLNSLTALSYDNKRKLILVICDGMIVGKGNDRPTPKIVLDILGVDPKTDPAALPFYSVGDGSEKLNYGKIYSGLYEFQGNVVPYLVVVKVGKQSEQSNSKPGNRGKRDSQVLLMRFLNRVHHRTAMNPLELEMFHQINNVIGVDPELYEYVLMVDADTMVSEESLTRLVSSCANDGKIAGICGETSLQNEEGSWWTMIQVYEYYISHHLSKAFESLFGSVTCLPGCFTMYRLRTPDTGKPLIIADVIISEYEDSNVDTLHKKNLLSLGEDRYLTTLMTKHFPQMSYKFVPDAFAYTAAPDTWSVLLSQRRRWINSTIHNLAELMFLKNLCGFCCFSMRFVVFIDLLGTIILPATCGYIIYLIYTVATGSGPIPWISIGMLAGVYGLQAIIFILKRQWQHIGWMIIYILAFPIFSFALPVYSFWKQDDFSWGNTRKIVEEKGAQKVVATTEEFNPRDIPLQTWDDYAGVNNLPGRRGDNMNDEMKSVYSSANPGSVIFDPTVSSHTIPYRQSMYSQAGYGSGASVFGHQGPAHMSSSHLSVFNQAQTRQSAYGGEMGMYGSDHLVTGATPMLGRPGSTVQLSNFSNDPRITTGVNGVSEQAIHEMVSECLREVNMDVVTKADLRQMVTSGLGGNLTKDQIALVNKTIDVQLAQAP